MIQPVVYRPRLKMHPLIMLIFPMIAAFSYDCCVGRGIAADHSAGRIRRLEAPTAEGSSNNGPNSAGKPPVPAENPGDWVTSADYPKWALYSGVEGVVRFALKVDQSGVVEDCEITESSKVQDLDNAACAALRMHARFLPARNENGEAVSGVWHSAVRWQVPAEQPVPTNGTLERTFVVGTDGTISDCRTERVDGSLAQAMKIEEVPCPDKSFIPPVDANGKPIRKKIIYRMIVEVRDLPD